MGIEKGPLFFINCVSSHISKTSFHGWKELQSLPVCVCMCVCVKQPSVGDDSEGKKTFGALLNNVGAEDKF